jgi:hypothetical protein
MVNRPHLGLSCIIHLGQKIHSSLLLADKDVEYTPRSHPLEEDSLFWKKLRDKGLVSKKANQWLELDLYESAKSIVESLVQGLVEDFTTGHQGNALETLYRIATSGKSTQFLTVAFTVAYATLGLLGDGQQSVYDQVIEALTDLRSSELVNKLDVMHRVLCSALDILGKTVRNDIHLMGKRSPKVCNLLSDLWVDEKYRQAAQEFVRQFTDRE